jgi:hypothetical protein
MNTSEYDGIWFLPLEDDSNALHMQYFSFRDEFKNSAKVDSSPNGDTYYISFFRRLENNEPEFDDAFEAVFADPEVYIKNLVGAKLYGCIVRKTEESGKWFEDYLKNVFGHVMIMKLKAYANSIANLE